VVSLGRVASGTALGVALRTALGVASGTALRTALGVALLFVNFNFQSFFGLACFSFAVASKTRRAFSGSTGHFILLLYPIFYFCIN
jgi:hypothetical protein